TALVCADALDFEVAVDLVAKRGRYMQEAVPQGVGAMAAIIGLSEEKIQALCTQISQEGKIVMPANYNSVGQVVIAGLSDAVDRPFSLTKEQGTNLAKRLQVSFPSHCPLIKPAEKKLAQTLKTINIKPPQIPIVNNVDVVVQNTAPHI